MPDAAPPPPPPPPLPASTTHPHFADRLADAIDRAGSPACVGLDPVLDKLPSSLRSPGDAASPHLAARAILSFSLGVIDAVADLVPAVKPQSACFERYGHAGVAALESVIAHARRAGLLVILDAKRGDIGLTAEHYAAAAFGPTDDPPPPHAADALTASPYLGPDTLQPLLRPGRGLFVLVRTSNPDSDLIQSATLADGRTVALHVAALVADAGRRHLGVRGLSSLGAVVGATKPADAAALRAAMPDQVFLVPGYGAQGGTLDDIRPFLRSPQLRHPTGRRSASPGDLGVLINASRSVLYPADTTPPSSWQAAIRSAAIQFRDELALLR